MKSIRFQALLLASLSLLLSQLASAQEVWQLQKTGVKASLRGLCVADNKVVWASGSEGTIIRTVDGGETWKNVSVSNASELDFRDIHAFDSKRAVILSAGQPARVYQTKNGGKSWKLTFEHPNEKSFFDAISFWDANHGIAMSDPVDRHVLLIETRDGGETWTELVQENRPKVMRGEGGFAASGTNMVVFGNKCFIALGSAEEGQNVSESRIVYSLDRGKSWQASIAPLRRNKSSGIFSVAFANEKNGIAVGGDYLNPDNDSSNIATTRDGGLTWQRPDGKSPSGYRSAVAYRRLGHSMNLVAVGPGGTDVSKDGGENWVTTSDEGFHAVAFSRDGRNGWASGSDGRIARWVGEVP